MSMNGKVPLYVFITLLFTLLIVSFNYWKLIEKNKLFKANLYANEEKLNQLISRKVDVEKQIEVNENQIKHLKLKINEITESLKKKENEVESINSLFNDKQKECNKIEVENKEYKNNLAYFCNTNDHDSELLEKYQTLKANFSNLVELIDKLNNTFDSFRCQPITNDAIIDFASKLSSVMSVHFTDKAFSRFYDLILGLIKGTLNTTTVKLKKYRIKTSNISSEFSMTDFRDKSQSEECTFQLDVGNCSSSMIRYFYDSTKNYCYAFSYTGCNGNSNNFETLKMCQDKCLR